MEEFGGEKRCREEPLSFSRDIGSTESPVKFNRVFSKTRPPGDPEIFELSSFGGTKTILISAEPPFRSPERQRIRKSEPITFRSPLLQEYIHIPLPAALLSTENARSICWYYYWHIWKYSSIYIYNWIIGICYLLVATYIWWITFGAYLLLLILVFWKSKIYLLLILVFGNHFCWVAYLLIG